MRFNGANSITNVFFLMLKVYVLLTENVNIEAASLNQQQFYPQSSIYTAKSMANVIYRSPMSFIYDQYQKVFQYFSATSFTSKSSQEFHPRENIQILANLKVNQTRNFDALQSSDFGDKLNKYGNPLSSKTLPSNLFNQSPKLKESPSEKYSKVPLNFEKIFKPQKLFSEKKSNKEGKSFSNKKNLKPDNKMTTQKTNNKDLESEDEYYYLYDDEAVELVL